MQSKTKDWVSELEAIMARLRADDGCPWDREQSHQTLKKYLIEEAYELVDAIDDGDDQHLADELGDLLLQVVFHCQIAREDGRFDLQAVARVIAEKLIRRHPHVFGDASVADADAVLRQWEQIKKSERSGKTRESAIDGVPRHLPALAQAEKIQHKAAKVGFDWPDGSGVLAKLHEEIDELQAAMAAGDQAAQIDELGDLLFSVVNLSRFCDVDAEDALRGATAKFQRRFRAVETAARRDGRPLAELTLTEMDALWDAVKAAET